MREWEATAETVAFCSLPYGVPKRLAPFLLLSLRQLPRKSGAWITSSFALAARSRPRGKLALGFPSVPRLEDARLAARMLAAPSITLPRLTDTGCAISRLTASRGKLA